MILDIGPDTAERFTPTVYLYDNYPGGIGLAAPLQLADFDLGVVNRKPDNVDLETLGRRFKTFLGRETPKEWGSEICQKFCNSTQTTR